MDTAITTRQVLESLWSQTQLPDNQLKQTILTGEQEVLPSSFRVTTAAQSSIAASASAACLIAGLRNDQNYQVSVNSLEAALECTSYFTVDDVSPPMWADFSGMYTTADGYIRVHANFDHHRDRFLEVLGVTESEGRAAVEKRVLEFTTDKLDNLITSNGGACAALRTFEQWNTHPQAAAVQAQPLISIKKINEAPARKLPPFDPDNGALGSVRCLDLTRILAGPVCGRALAAYGADVMLVNSPNLPNIESIIETSRGKLSTHLDLTSNAGITAIHQLLKDTNIFVQGYRPGALAALQLDAETLCDQHPGLIAVSLSAYGNRGPWNEKRGFDSLVQTATGFNAAEANAYHQETPKALPVQIMDYATGFLMAFGAQAALFKQLTEGGSYHVELSLARTALWVNQLRQSTQHLSLKMPEPTDFLQHYDSQYGQLKALPHAGVFENLPNHYRRPSVPPGTHPPVWPPLDWTQD